MGQERGRQGAGEGGTGTEHKEGQAGNRRRVGQERGEERTGDRWRVGQERDRQRAEAGGTGEGQTGTERGWDKTGIEGKESERLEQGMQFCCRLPSLLIN